MFFLKIYNFTQYMATSFDLCHRLFFATIDKLSPS
jgi:hypothetical protein